MADRSFIDVLDGEWRAIADLGRQLRAEDWDRPTDCPGWTVRDQVSHMIGTESSLLGRPAPPAAGEGLPHVKNALGEMNEAWVEARRGNEVLAEFEEVTTKRLDQLRAMTDDELDNEMPSPIGVVPYSAFMNVRIMDCWVHEQDIRRAVGRPGGFDTPAAAIAFERFGTTLGFVVGKRAGAPDGATVVFDLSGPQARTLAVGMQGGRANAIDPPTDPTVRLSMSTETFARLVGGRASKRADVEQEGDKALGDAIVANMATLP